MSEKVYLLTHFRNEDELDGFKVIGVFSSVDEAEKAKSILITKPGFSEFPNNFDIDGYKLNKMFWVDGFG